MYIFCFLQFYHGGCPTVFLPNGSSRNLSYASPSPFSNPDLVRFDIIITLFNPQNGAAHCEIRSPTRISTEFYRSPHVCWINANVLPSAFWRFGIATPKRSERLLWGSIRCIAKGLPYLVLLCPSTPSKNHRPALASGPGRCGDSGGVASNFRHVSWEYHRVVSRSASPFHHISP